MYKLFLIFMIYCLPFCNYYSSAAYGMSNADLFEHSDLFVNIFGEGGNALKIDVNAIQCPQESKVSICLAMTMRQAAEGSTEGVFGLERWVDSRIYTKLDLNDHETVKGELKVVDPKGHSSVIGYAVKTKKLPVWVQKNPKMIALMMVMHPVLAESLLADLKLGNNDDKPREVLDLALKTIPIPEEYIRYIPEGLSAQVHHIDLLDHYSLMLRVDSTQGHINAYLSDRLGSDRRSIKTAFRSALGYANALELVHHGVELLFYTTCVISSGGSFTLGAASKTLLGFAVHGMEIYEHLKQFFESKSAQDLLKEGDTAANIALEGGMLAHASFEAFELLGDGAEFAWTQALLRPLAATLSLINFLKDQIPENLFEQSWQPSVRAFISKEFNMTMPVQKDHYADEL